MSTRQEPPTAKVPKPRASGALRRRDKWLLIGLAIAVVTFAAISITVNALRPDVPTTSNSSTIDPRVQDSDFVVHLGQEAGPGMTQQQTIAMGRATCASLVAGKSRAEAAASLTAQGLTAEQAAALLSAALEAYCPAKR